MSLWWIGNIILLVVVVLVFGTKKLKHLGTDLGGAIRGFKDAMEEDRNPGTTCQQLTGDANRTSAGRTDEER